jgi:hypothetical protein
VNQRSIDITPEIASENELNTYLIVKDGLAVANYIRETLAKEKLSLQELLGGR